jgi:zinc transport system substrate-binding protein
MTRKAIAIFLSLLALLTLLSCKNQQRQEKPLVVASIYPYELLLTELLGDVAEVRTLIPPAASPHTYSPKPSEIKDLHKASLVFSNGMGLEMNFQEIFKSLDDKHLVAEELLEIPSGEEELNPHIWLSPLLMQKLALKLSPELQRIFPEHRDEIANNAVDMVATMSRLDRQISVERKRYPRTPVITYHDSFHYFLAEYRLEYLGSVQGSPGEEPTPKELSRLGDLIKANGVKAIFVEPQMDRRSASVLADEFGLRIIELDPIGNTLQPATLADMIASNWERMKQAW